MRFPSTRRESHPVTRLHLALTTVLALAVAGLSTGVIPAGANHQFPDVPTGSAFHDAVDNFTNAGCATGFPDGTYRPTDPVNRQQMARFMNACGGRVTYGEGFVGTLPLDNVGTIPLITQTMTAGALGEGGGFVAATASVRLGSTSTTTTDFPCEAIFRLMEASAGQLDALPIDLPEAVVGEVNDSGALLGLIPVDAGETVTVEVVAAESSQPACSATLFGEAGLMLEYVPFQGDGAGGGEG
jgi:hypothetical protein